MSVGYSKTPLWKKLGYKENMKSVVINEYDAYRQDLKLPFELIISTDISAENKVEFIHFFTKSKNELSNEFAGLKSNLVYNGILWISWPKKASKVITDVNENVVRKIGLASGLVDVKVAAINEVWSGLKFMYRLIDRM